MCEGLPFERPTPMAVATITPPITNTAGVIAFAFSDFFTGVDARTTLADAVADLANAADPLPRIKASAVTVAVADLRSVILESPEYGQAYAMAEVFNQEIFSRLREGNAAHHITRKAAKSKDLN